MPSGDRLTPAVFLDRDGTLMEDVGYCGDPAHVRVYAGVPESLLRLRAAGYKLIVVTNQSGIAYGYFTEADYQAVHGEFVRQLRPAGLDGTYHAPDDPKQPTSRRKPAPGMLLEAAREHGIDLARSFMVGDHASDIMAGHAAGVRAIKVMTGHGDHEPDAGADAVVADFSAAVEWILSG